jgi:hypothetical protein
MDIDYLVVKEMVNISKLFDYTYDVNYLNLADNMLKNI